MLRQQTNRQSNIIHYGLPHHANQQQKEMEDVLDGGHYTSQNNSTETRISFSPLPARHKEGELFITQSSSAVHQEHCNSLSLVQSSILISFFVCSNLPSCPC